MLTVGEILSGDPLPGCWNVQLSESELKQAHLENSPTTLTSPGWTWYWERCLIGIGPAPTFTISDDGPEITSAVVWKQPGSKITLLSSLTPNQQRLIGLYAAGKGDYPPVVAIASGGGLVRVNQWVAFHGVPAASAVLRVGGGAMQARVTHLRIQPLGASAGSAVDCDAAGEVVGTGDTHLTTAPGAACWYQFTKSSAGQPNDSFQMAVTATWVVAWTFAPGSPWNTWNKLPSVIQSTTITQQKVTEVQTIVVPCGANC